MKSYDRCFITGCDEKTEWMLPWFIDNYIKHNDTPIILADFGMSKDTRAWAQQVSQFEEVMEIPKQRVNGWFLKPKTFLMSPGKETCWVDTDIHILGDMSGIFDYVEPNKLAMVEDKPWTTRMREKWHNSGVVAFKGTPPILKTWVEACSRNPKQGDQEVLHELVSLSPLMRMQHISDVPNVYNWLRVQLLDGQDDPNKIAMHWTGLKGKQKIEKMIYNSNNNLKWSN